MYWETSANEIPVPLSGLSRLAMSVLIAGIIFFGVYSQPILNALKQPTVVVTETAIDSD
jgi:NADH:ubiquinone oxidoreductase subunit 4 (subunit M)